MVSEEEKRGGAERGGARGGAERGGARGGEAREVVVVTVAY